MLENIKGGNFGWLTRNSNIAISYVLVLTVVVLLAYNVQAVNPLWFIGIIIISVWYFYTLYYCNKNWQSYEPLKFKKKLFWHSLFYRIVASVILIIVAQLTWNQPHYVGAVDAISYHREALIVADHFRNFDFQNAFRTAVSFTGQVDNSGPPMLIGFIYAFLGKYYFTGTVFFALLSSISVVLLYRISEMIWGEKIGRLTGIMFMHFPLALFYSVVFLKEGIVVVLMILIVYLVTKAINGYRLSPINFIILIAAMVTLFFFRTAVGALCAVLVPVSFLINNYKGNRLKSLFIGVTAATAFAAVIIYIGEYQFFINRITTAEMVGDQRTEYLEMEQVDLFDFSLMDFALFPVYAVLAFIAPFASLVEVGTRYNLGHNHIYYNMAGTIIWNILTYFSVIGLYYSIKEKFFESFMVWAFTGGYIYILVVTVLFTRDRFAYIGMPLMLALAAVGVYRTKNKIYWMLYLAIILIMTVIWNYLRLNVRGM